MAIGIAMMSRETGPLTSHTVLLPMVSLPSESEVAVV